MKTFFQNIVGKKDMLQLFSPFPTTYKYMYSYVIISFFKAFEPSPKQTCGFMCLRNKCYENSVGQGEIAR